MAPRANPAPKRRNAGDGPQEGHLDGRALDIHPGQGRDEPAADPRRGSPDDGARALELALITLNRWGVLERVRGVEVPGCRVSFAPSEPPKDRVDPEAAIKERERLEEELAYMSS